MGDSYYSILKSLPSPLISVPFSRTRPGVPIGRAPLSLSLLNQGLNNCVIILRLSQREAARPPGQRHFVLAAPADSDSAGGKEAGPGALEAHEIARTAGRGPSDALTDQGGASHLP